MSIKLGFIILCVFIFGCSKEFERDDLYVDKLVYLKRDSTLFTGTIKVDGESSYYYESFCQGMPCGEWGEFLNNGGAVVQKGKYLTKDMLSKSTHDLIGTDIFLINHYQDGEGPEIKYPGTLTIMIIKEESFFNSKEIGLEEKIFQLAKAVKNDTQTLQYDYLMIRLVNSPLDWTKEYSKDYRIQNGELIEN